MSSFRERLSLPPRSTLLKLLLLLVVLASSAGVAVSILASRARPPGPTPPPTTTATAAATSTLTPSPSATAPPSPSPSPPPTIPPGPSATLKLTQLGLTAGGPAATLTFTSEGDGLVTVQLQATTGPATVCLRPGSGAASCQTRSGPANVTLPSSGARETWALTLRSTAAQALVTFTVTFPSRSPSVRLTGARFGGTAYPGFDGIDLRLVPRAAGSATLSANWGVSYRYQFTVKDTTRGDTLVSLLATGTSLTRSFGMAPPDAWRVALTNHTKVPPTALLTIVFSWP